MKQHRVCPIPLCQGPRDGSNWTYLMRIGETVGSCCYVWYIESSEPKALVDAGCTAQAFRDRGLTEEDIQTVETGLSKLGLKPRDINIVIMTHLHFDHVLLAAKYTNAKFIVQKAELESVLNPHPMIVLQGSYDRQLLKNINMEIIEGDREIIDGVRVMLTPGHTAGGQSVLVDTADGLAIITGFCCTYDNFNPPPKAKARGFEVVAPGRHINVLQAYDSVLKVKKMGDIILPVHDPSFMSGDPVPSK